MSPLCGWAYLAQGDAIPDCVGEGAAAAAAALAMVGVGTGNKGVVLGDDASTVDMRVDMTVDRTVGTSSGVVVLVVVAESEPSCAGAVLEATQ